MTEGAERRARLRGLFTFELEPSLSSGEDAADEGGPFEGGSNPKRAVACALALLSIFTFPPPPARTQPTEEDRPSRT